MQLVPFTESSGYEQTTRSSRMVNYYPENGKGTAISYLEALRSNLGVPKECITPVPPKVNTFIPQILDHISNDPKNSLSTVSHKKQTIGPLKINTFIPLIPNYISQNPRHSLSTTHNKKATPNALKDSIQVSSLPSIPEKNLNLKDKPKRKQKSIEDILGLSKHMKTKKGGRKGKQRCVVFRSAMATAALSVSTEGITNRNRILLSESKAAWSVTKILGNDYMGNDEEVISRFMVTDEEVELRAAHLPQSQ